MNLITPYTSVPSMSVDEYTRVVLSSARTGCFLVFASVCALSVIAEATHASRRIRSVREERVESNLTFAPKPHKASSAKRGETAHAAISQSSRRSRLSAKNAKLMRFFFVVKRDSKLYFARFSMGGIEALLACRASLRAWAEFGVVLGLFFFADRTNFLGNMDKSYDRDLFLVLFLGFAAYGWSTSLQKSNTAEPLNREQTEEWKGWMQVLFLLYHYFKASEVYNAIRLCIASYVWMTGFGNFSYYHGQKDFSSPRFWQMMWRLNFFVFFTCIIMNNSYTLYYICPMHTMFTFFVYFILLVYKDYNCLTRVIVGKLFLCAFLVFVIWEVPGVFGVVFRPLTFLLRYTDPERPDIDPMHEWFFRSGLDRYIWIYGMGCAYVLPQFEAFLTWVDTRRVLIRVATQTMIAGATFLVIFWYYQTYYMLPKNEYNKIHPYTSWIPITCFIILRNLTLTARSVHANLFCKCGRITLETYISQFHVWLSTSNIHDGQPNKLFCLIPGYPLLNFVVATIAYLGISRRVFVLTNVLKATCVPTNSQKIRAHAAFGVIIALISTATGFVVVESYERRTS
jgi:hypothetical protein